MEIVAHGVLLGQALEVGRITRAHVEEAHFLTALHDIAGRGADAEVVGVIASARLRRYPGKKVMLGIGAARLLPHLEEAVHRIAGYRQGRGVGHVGLGNLEGAVGGADHGGQPVDNLQAVIAHIKHRPDQVNLGFPGTIAAGAGGVDRITARVRGRVLLGQADIAAVRAFSGDDALGQQIENALAAGRLVGGEQVVEGVVFTDHDDHVLDRRGGVVVVGISRLGAV